MTKKEALATIHNGDKILFKSFHMKNLVTCLSCSNYAFWDGDPCCISEMRIVIPDKNRECIFHKECSEQRFQLNKQVWEKAKGEWLSKNTTEKE